MEYISYNEFIDNHFVTKVSLWITNNITHHFPKTKSKWLSLLKNQFRKCKIEENEIRFKKFRYDHDGYFFVNENYLFKRLLHYGIINLNRNKVIINKRYFIKDNKRKYSNNDIILTKRKCM